MSQPTPLPLRRVVLFTSGVGFFEHAGEVTGEATAELRFDVRDVNDLLKSMVVRDAGGRVGAVTYGAQAPVERTLRTFAVDLTDDPTLAELLGRLRGERVELEGNASASGTIVGVETREEKVGRDETIETAWLNLMADDGLRSVPLGGMTRIRLVNERLDAEIREALEVLAGARDTDKKTVRLSFLGEGTREAGVGYIREAPVWKTSYRLVLADDRAPYLQGWAIVENATEHDWRDVALRLVSGRPISFRMNLYEPLFVERPLVEPEQWSGLRPQLYDGAVPMSADVEFAGEADADGVAMTGSVQKLARKARSRALGVAGQAANRAMLLEDADKSIEVQAAGAEVGEQFAYTLESPVSLDRQRSAMLPIVSGDVDAERLSIYNEAVQPRHPLRGLRLVNSTGLHLMEGPITVFDEGVYAGDARIRDLAPGEERIVSYAVDLDVEVAPERKPYPEELVRVKIVRGTLHAERRQRRTARYRAKNSDERPRKLLVEQPLEAGWNLTAPADPPETTRDRYRFAVDLAARSEATLEVTEERPVVQKVALVSLDARMIGLYMKAEVVSEAIKDRLREIGDRQQALAALAAERGRHEERLAAIDAEQARLRQNMAELDRAADLYQRYVQKLAAQEDEVERLREEVARLIEEEAAQRRALESDLADVTLG